MEIKEFITLKTIVETGSYTLASKKLHYAQSTLTAHIKTLEENLGQDIFERKGKKLSLTNFGKEVYEESLQLIKTYEKIKEIPFGKDIPSGKLIIGTAESIMMYKLYPIIKEYRELYPQVNIIIKSGICQELKKSLARGELDLCFLLENKTGFDEREKILFKTYSKEKLCIVLPPDYEESELSSEKDYNILNTERGCYYRNMFNEYLKSCDIPYNDSLQTESVELIKKYVMCNLGISFLPLYAIKKELEEKKLKAIFPNEEYSLYLTAAYQKDRWLAPSLDAFLKLADKFLI